MLGGETTELSLQCLYGWISRYGIPESIYTDRRSVYYTKRQKTIEEEFEGEEVLTELGKVCKELRIELIFANSPQEKGRIERSNGVHQDRLIKLLKHKGIKTIEESGRGVLGQAQCQIQQRTSLRGRPSCSPFGRVKPQGYGMFFCEEEDIKRLCGET